MWAYINSPKLRHFGLIDYVYIGLVGCVALSCNTYAKMQKQCEINIFFKILGLKKLKQTQNTKNRYKLFSKYFKVCPK